MSVRIHGVERTVKRPPVNVGYLVSQSVLAEAELECH